ncbi:MAG: acetate--CoA ligase family protein [Candidatus Omnitrophica bacterium]|nr:acetate--CoA ligase family protein [Candidatus Omnitrophota bacterium]
MGSKAAVSKGQKKLNALFEPESIAVIGASRRKEAVGFAILHNLIAAGYKGKIYPVNPKVDELEGMRCYHSVDEIPAAFDLAVIIIPSSVVPEMLRQCGEKGAQAAIVISAGFREVSKEGAKLEQEVSKIADEYGMPVLGPNCLGMINASSKMSMNASFSATMPKEGNIAFLSQSGALCTAILDYAKGENIGFSKFISLGNKVDLNEVDILRYLKEDPETDVVLMYIEDLVDGRAFIDVAREMTGDLENGKPILAIKAGRTAQGAKAAQSHTGSLMGSDKVYDAIFAQAGVLRLDSVAEMFDLGIAFANEPLPKSNRVAIVTNAGGPGIMATDACVRYGLEMAELEQTTREALAKVLPPTANLNNPVDVIGDAQHDRYEQALKIVAQDPNVDGIIVILTPQAMTDIKEIADVVVQIDKQTDIPLIACFMGIVDVTPGVKVLEENFVPHYRFPEETARALGAMYRYQQWMKRPRTDVVHFKVEKDRATKILKQMKQPEPSVLPIHDAMAIFEAYGFPVLPYGLAHHEGEAREISQKVGFPIAMKIVSNQVVHKFDVGGVRLNINSPEEAAKAYCEIVQIVSSKSPGALIEGVLIQRMAQKGREVILGMNRDPHFGPTLMFGLGGIYVEALKDVTFRLAPIRELTARHMIKMIRAYPILKGIRGEKPADFAKIAECLERLSQLVCENPQISEVDINPLMVYEVGLGAAVVDARIVID